MSGILWWELSSLYRLTPTGRASARLYLVVSTGSLYAVAGSRAGDWLAGTVFPAVATAGGIALVCALTVTAWFLQELRDEVGMILSGRRMRRLRIPISVFRTLVIAARAVSGRGLLVFCAAALGHPSAALVRLSLALAVTEFVLAGCSLKVLHGNRRWVNDLVSLKRASRWKAQFPIEQSLERWARSLLLDPRHRRGATLVQDLLGQASMALRRTEEKHNDRFGGGGRQAYEEWLALADRAMDVLLTESGKPGVRDEARRTVAYVHAQWASHKSFECYLSGEWDEAVRLGRLAVAEFTRAGMVDTAAVEALSLVELLLTPEVDRPEEAEDVLTTLRTDPRLASPVVRMVQEQHVQLLLRHGHVETARALWEASKNEGAGPDEGSPMVLLAESGIRAGRIQRGLLRWLGRQERVITEAALARRFAAVEGASAPPAADRAGNGPPEPEMSPEDRELYRSIRVGAAARQADAEALLNRHYPHLRGLDRLVVRRLLLKRLRRAGRRPSLRDELPFGLQTLMFGRGLEWMWDLESRFEDFTQLSDAGLHAEAEALFSERAAINPLARRWAEFPVLISRAGLALGQGDRPGAYRLLLEAFAVSEHERLRVGDPTYRAQSVFQDAAAETAVNLLAEDVGVRAVHAEPAAEAFRISELSRSRMLLDLLHTGSNAGAGGGVTPGAGSRDLEVFSPLRYAEIMELLPPDGGAVFAEFFIGHTHVTLFVGRRDYPEPVLLRFPLTGEEFGLLARARPAADTAAAERLVAGMLAELLPHTEPGKLLWLVPHRQLHYLPLHAVAPAGGPSLAERHPVCFTPSASVMHFCQRLRTGPYRSVLTLADAVADRPLMHARAEAAAVAGFFEEAVSRSGSEVTGEEITALLRERSFDVLHVATHGFFDSARPLDSGVDVAGGGRLTARDILGLRLDAQLVVLSACESGLGEQRGGGEELFGLTRALLYAGVGAVLVTLWKVDDASTGLLMGAFYRGLLDGLPKPEALAAAQRAVREATTAEVVGYCEQVRAAAPDPVGARRLDREIADLLVRAGDYRAAAWVLGRAQETLGPGDPEAVALARLAARCEARAQRAGGQPRPSAAPEVRPYTDPYHWAPFVLIGDWR
ncbi:CHAT domain-containing protein [Streptomyces collinus]|uniref:CHAT domain-containing protein n=1 Tax=Streptomyces collinus TaxID=42684 RepID=UPI0037B2D857